MNLLKVPRYVISYSICDLAAIYIANVFKKDKKKGAEMFIKLGEVGNSMDYNASMEYLGLKSAFDEEVIIEAAEYLRSELGL